MRVWDLESGEPAMGPLTGHDGAVRSVAVGVRLGRPVIVSGSYDQTLRVWDLAAEAGDILRIELGRHVTSVASTAAELVIGASPELLRLDLP